LFAINPVWADPGASVMTQLFSKVCLPDTRPPAWMRVAVWVLQQHLPEITNPKARKVYVGEGPNGKAWWLRGKDTETVLALRSEGMCAVYAGSADPVALDNYFDGIMKDLSKKGPVTTPLPDRYTPSAYGMRVRKARVFTSPDKHTDIFFLLITDERPGGPYQGTLQVSMGADASKTRSSTSAPGAL